MSVWLLGYLVCGVFAGFFAGLLGIGGGIMIVPILLYIFNGQGFDPENMMKMALATSMAAIMFTSVSSLRTHSQIGNVRWDIVKRAVPGVIIGTALGGLVVRYIDTRWLTGIFLVFVFYIATNMMLAITPKPSRQLPGPAGQTLFGAVIGFLSSLLAAGGGFLTVPYLHWCNIDMRKAIGTSAALGFPIALSGTFWYIINGWDVAARPEGALGYVYVPGVLGIIAMSIFLAPIGAKCSQKLAVKPLKRIFALLLYATAIKMLIDLLSH